MGVSPVRALAVAIGLVAFGLGSAWAGYTPVEWIKADGSQWINTGYVPNGTEKIEVKVKFSTVTEGQFVYVRDKPGMRVIVR